MSKNAAADQSRNRMTHMPNERTELGKQLLDEIGTGSPDLDTIKSLIARGADIEFRDHEKHRTPLLAASAGSRRNDAAAILLAAGANPNVRGDNGATPLMMAVLMKNAELLDMLIQHGAALDDTGFKGKTPLMWAAHLGASDIVDKLLAAGADAEMKMPTGMDAAAFAGSNNKIRIQKNIHQHIENRKTAKAAFDAALKAGMPLDHDIAPIRMSTPRKRRTQNQPHRP